MYFARVYEHSGEVQDQAFGKKELGWKQVAVDKELAVVVAKPQFDFATQSKIDI